MEIFVKYGIMAVCLALVSLTGAYSQHPYANSDSTAAEYKNYYFVLLTKGPQRDQDSASAARIQEGHLANIRRLVKEGKMEAAGPFLDDGYWRGIFIFDAASKEEVEMLLRTDPAIKSGRLAYEIHPWMTAKGTCFD